MNITKKNWQIIFRTCENLLFTIFQKGCMDEHFYLLSQQQQPQMTFIQIHTPADSK
jgi:hypothetical protein